MCAHAGLQISPVIVDIPGEKGATTVVVTNTGDDSLTVQVRPFDWVQTEGQDVLTASKALAVSPPLFTVAPHKQQIVRLVFNGPKPVQQEQAFRVMIDELPLPHDQTTIQLPIRFNIPVFVGGTVSSTTDVAWIVHRTHGNSIQLVAENRGDRRARISHLTVSNSAGGRLASVPGLSGYVLAGQKYAWDFTLSNPLKQDNLHLTGFNEALPLDVALRVDAP